MGSKLSTGRRVDAVNAFTSADGDSDALFEAAAELYGINRETVGGTIQIKGKISANTELLALLEVHFKGTMKSLRAIRDLKNILPKSRAVVLILRDRDGDDNGDGDGTDRLKTLENLKTMRLHLEKLKPAGDQHVQLSVLDDLRRKKHDLHQNLERIKAWRKAWNIGQWIANFGVTVLSVVFPVARVRAVATAANNGAGGVIALLQPLVDFSLNDQQSSCEDEINLTERILNEAAFIFHRINGVRVLVEHLVVEMGLLIQYAELSTGEDEDEAVRMVEEKKIKRKAGDFVDTVEDMEKKVDRGCEDVREAALTLLKTVTDQVGNYQHIPVEIQV